MITTVPTMIVAERGLPSVWLMIVTVMGGALAAGGANTFNMYIDRDIDGLMARTQGRPLVTGAVTPRSALLFGLVLEAASVAAIGQTVNLVNWYLKPTSMAGLNSVID